MIMTRLHRLRFEKEEKEARKLTYDVLEQETGLSRGTLVRLFSREPLERVDGKTLSTLCAYFVVGVGDVLEYHPDQMEKEQVAA